MSLQNLPLDSISTTHLLGLIEAKTRESAVIEYKRDFALGSDDQKREFLYDVVSFANSAGGDLIYGIAAKDGEPEEIVGLAGFVVDAEQLRMESLLRSNISPRLAGVGFRAIPGPNGQAVLVVRVPRSLTGPHMVKHGSWTRFYARNSAGKYELDAGELRRAFLASEGVYDRLREFRMERLRRILGNALGVSYKSPRRVVLHILPVATIRDELSFTIPQLLAATGPNIMAPYGEVSSWGPRFNYDGLVIESVLQQAVWSSLQLFRNGAVEVIDAASAITGTPLLPAKRIEFALRRGLPTSLKYLGRLGVPPPYVLGLSVLGVKGLAIVLNPGFGAIGVTPIAEDHLILPEVTISDPASDVDSVLRPLFDRIWNACGYERSMSYDSGGVWES